jgi:hypothetical protein
VLPEVLRPVKVQRIRMMLIVLMITRRKVCSEPARSLAWFRRRRPAREAA